MKMNNLYSREQILQSCSAGGRLQLGGGCYIWRDQGGSRAEDGLVTATGGLATAPAAAARGAGDAAARVLVERFDIEPFPDFSAK